MPTSVDWNTAQPKFRDYGIRLKNRWISLGERPTRSPMGTIAVGKEGQRSTPQTPLGKGTKVGVSSCPPKVTTISFSVDVNDVKMDGKKRKIRHSFC